MVFCLEGILKLAFFCCAGRHLVVLLGALAVVLVFSGWEHSRIRVCQQTSGYLVSGDLRCWESRGNPCACCPTISPRFCMGPVVTRSSTESGHDFHKRRFDGALDHLALRVAGPKTATKQEWTTSLTLYHHPEDTAQRGDNPRVRRRLWQD